MWQRIVVLLAVVGLSLPGPAHGKTIKDPIADYISTEEFAFGLNDLKIDHINRVDLDLNGDGEKVVFLSCTYVRQGGYAWTVYVPGEHGYTIGFPSPPERDMLSFTENNCYVGYIREIKHRGIIFFGGRAVEGFEYLAFWVSGDRARIKKISSTKGRDLDKRYFTKERVTGSDPAFQIETISIDDLRAKRYAIPSADK